MLRTLGKQAGILGDIFAQSMPRFNNPVNLKRLISLIDETQWTSLDKDVKAEAFEGLLEKAASEGKKGAGQFFTPRPLIQSICDVMRPDPRPRNDITIKKDRPLTRDHFADFVACYGADPNGRSPRRSEQSKDGRWRSFHISEVKERDFKLDSFKWIKDESLEDADELPEPEELATDAIAELEAAVGELNAVLALLESENRALAL